MNTEMLALLVEVLSIQVAGKGLRKPITGLVKSVAPPKPKAAQTAASAAARDAAFKRGMDVLGASARVVRPT